MRTGSMRWRSLASSGPNGNAAPSASPSGGLPLDGEAFRIAVLVSGSGTNLQAIIDSLHGRDGVEIAAVASSKDDVKALERAQAAGLETGVFESARYPSRAERDRAMAAWLKRRHVALVVLAGFMELLDSSFLAEFPAGVINVHPALLPAFPGAHPVEDQIAYGVKVGGVTVHFVDDGVDTGPIILQQAVPLPYTRSKEDVLTVLHEAEHELLPRAIRLIADGRVRFDERNPRMVLVDEQARETTRGGTDGQR
jgi:phosphoribosylglycinamide formyltransferase-1